MTPRTKRVGFQGAFRGGSQVSLILLLGVGGGLSGQQNSSDPVTPAGNAGSFRPSLQAARLEGDISIDGRLDEEVWSTAPVASGFIQGTPVEGVPEPGHADRDGQGDRLGRTRELQLDRPAGLPPPSASSPWRRT